MTSFVPLDEATSRKRKQESSSLSDYIYSSPNSPSHPMNLPTDLMDHSYSFGLDSMLTTFEYPSANNDNQTMLQHPIEHIQDFNNVRRHSVAVGELDYQHYHHLNNTNNSDFGYVKQESLDGMNWDQTDLQQLLSGGDINLGHTSLPSSFSSHSSGGTLDSVNATLDQHPMPHQRTMSLRLESLSSSPSYDHTAASASPTTPVFFAPSFLDSLSAATEEDGNSFTNHSLVDSISATVDVPHQQLATTSVPDNQLGLSSDFLVHPGQLAMQSSVLTSTTNQQQQYNYQQQQQHEMWMMDTATTTQPAKRQSISKRRASTKSNKSPPPSSPATTMSTSSPSPPITPSQQLNNGFESFHHSHPSIPEEDDDMAFGTMATTTSRVSDEKNDQVMERRVSAERRAKNSLVSARIIQGENTATQLKPLIQQYLLSNDPTACGEHSVTLLTSKVAQKSYGTEKRFLCPPPTTILSGASWWTTSADGQDTTTNFYPSSSGTLCAPKLTIHISGESTSQNGALEWCNAQGTVIDNTSSLAATAHASHLGETTMSGKCVSKQLHINDADEKRRRVEVLAKIQLGNNIHLGTLASKGIKVISKPSKKRQSVKNMELCIHHGTTVSLFNRIRSQTVSTKYLGVSNGNASSGNNGNNTGTCFVARTGSWDPFVIWIVDTSRSPESASSTPPRMPHHPLNPDFPPPPAIALQSGISHQAPIALHYNQPVVLQCVSTGLVSPVLVIRKVDKGSAVLGGNRVEDLTGLTGGECGDEAIGDPVSQLHKIAFQIVQDPSVAHTNKANYQPHPYSAMASSMCTDWTLPQTSHPVTYLACLNDVVGMHKTTTMRTLVSTRPPRSPATAPLPSWNIDMPTYSNTDPITGRRMSSVISSQIEAAGKVVRKRRVSCDVVNGNNSKFTVNNGTTTNFGKPAGNNSQRRRVNSLNDVPTRTTLGNTENTGPTGRRGSLADRRLSISSDNGNPVDGNCWTEDVSDAAVWTIVATERVSYTFWTPPPQQDDTQFNNPFTQQQSHPITPFPTINQINASGSTGTMLMITGENLSRDLSVWFGDIRAPSMEYKSRDLLSCTVPEDSVLAASPVAKIDEECPNLRKLPILLVRGDGVVYRTGEFYTF